MNWNPGQPLDLSHRVVELARHMQRLEPGAYMVMIVKTTHTAMDWRVLPVQTPLEKGPPPSPQPGA